MGTRLEVWTALADLIVCIEPRVRIPDAALCLLEAGLSRGEAYDVWCFEVWGAVMNNPDDDRSDWVHWNRDWLVAEIARTHVARAPYNRVFYRLWARDHHANWRAIEACMGALANSSSPSERAASLTWMACCFFDFCGQWGAHVPAGPLTCVYETAFLPVFRPLARSSDGGFAVCDERVKRAMVRLEATGPYRRSGT